MTNDTKTKPFLAEPAPFQVGVAVGEMLETLARLRQKLHQCSPAEREILSEQVRRLTTDLAKTSRDEDEYLDMTRARFPVGMLMQSMVASLTIDERDLIAGLYRHVEADWGECTPQQRSENDTALIQGGKLLSTFRTVCGREFYVLTSTDRSTTTFVTPAEYEA